LLAEARVVGDVELFGERMQLGDGFLLQLGDIHGSRTPLCGIPLCRTPLGSWPPINRRASLRGGQMSLGSKKQQDRSVRSGTSLFGLGLSGEISGLQVAPHNRSGAYQRQGHSVDSITPYLDAWRVIRAGPREIVEGLVSPAHRGPSAELRAALAAWPHVHYWGAADHAELVLVRPVAPRRQEAWLLHLVLFAVTVLCAVGAGAALEAV